MSGEDERWRMPGLTRLGEQLRELEDAESEPASQPGRRAWWRLRRLPALAPAAVAVLVALALVAGTLELVAPAGASSPVNQAPAAAARSRSVRFSSSLDVTLAGGTSRRFAETGALDFATGEYDATLRGSGRALTTERRRVGDVLYVVAIGTGPRGGSPRWRAIRLGPGAHRIAERRVFSLIDPQTVFRVLSRTEAPVTRIGSREIRGERVVQYKLATTLAAFLGAQNSPLAGVGSYENVDATLNVWLDVRGRPRRVQASFLDPRSPSTVMTAHIDFSAYGAPVAVSVPPDAIVSHRPGSVEVGPLGGDPIAVLQRALFARP